MERVSVSSACVSGCVSKKTKRTRSITALISACRLKRLDSKLFLKSKISYRAVISGKNFDVNFAQELLGGDLDDLIQNDADAERVFRRAVV